MDSEAKEYIDKRFEEMEILLIDRLEIDESLRFRFLKKIVKLFKKNK